MWVLAAVRHGDAGAAQVIQNGPAREQRRDIPTDGSCKHLCSLGSVRRALKLVGFAGGGGRRPVCGQGDDDGGPGGQVPVRLLPQDLRDGGRQRARALRAHQLDHVQPRRAQLHQRGRGRLRPHPPLRPGVLRLRMRTSSLPQSTRPLIMAAVVDVDAAGVAVATAAARRLSRSAPLEARSPSSQHARRAVLPACQCCMTSEARWGCSSPAQSARVARCGALAEGQQEAARAPKSSPTTGLCSCGRTGLVRAARSPRLRARLLRGTAGRLPAGRCDWPLNGLRGAGTVAG
jgi:hypothetical protein